MKTSAQIESSAQSDSKPAESDPYTFDGKPKNETSRNIKTM